MVEFLYLTGVPAFDYFFTFFIFLTFGFVVLFAAMSFFRS